MFRSELRENISEQAPRSFSEQAPKTNSEQAPRKLHTLALANAQAPKTERRKKEVGGRVECADGDVVDDAPGASDGGPGAHGPSVRGKGIRAGSVGDPSGIRVANTGIRGCARWRLPYKN